MHFWTLSVLFLLVGAAPAFAQTVIVRNVPAAEAIEVFVNSTKSGSGTTDPAGTVRLPMSLKAAGVTADMDSRVYVDVCTKLRRIHVVDRNMQPMAKEDGCDRRE